MENREVHIGEGVFVGENVQVGKNVSVGSVDVLSKFRELEERIAALESRIKALEKAGH